MAEVLQKFESNRGRYPWHDWADGRPWRARQGVDFDCSPNGFRSTVYNYAKANKMRVQVTVSQEDKTVTFQFLVPTNGKKR